MVVESTTVRIKVGEDETTVPLASTEPGWHLIAYETAALEGGNATVRQWPHFGDLTSEVIFDGI